MQVEKEIEKEEVEKVEEFIIKDEFFNFNNIMALYTPIKVLFLTNFSRTYTSFGSVIYESWGLVEIKETNYRLILRYYIDAKTLKAFLVLDDYEVKIAQYSLEEIKKAVNES